MSTRSIFGLRKPIFSIQLTKEPRFCISYDSLLTIATLLQTEQPKSAAKKMFVIKRAIYQTVCSSFILRTTWTRGFQDYLSARIAGCVTLLLEIKLENVDNCSKNIFQNSSFELMGVVESICPRRKFSCIKMFYNFDIKFSSKFFQP